MAKKSLGLKSAFHNPVVPRASKGVESTKGSGPGKAERG